MAGVGVFFGVLGAGAITHKLYKSKKKRNNKRKVVATGRESTTKTTKRNAHDPFKSQYYRFRCGEGFNHDSNGSCHTFPNLEAFDKFKRTKKWELIGKKDGGYLHFYFDPSNDDALGDGNLPNPNRFFAVMEDKFGEANGAVVVVPMHNILRRHFAALFIRKLRKQNYRLFIVERNLDEKLLFPLGSVLDDNEFLVQFFAHIAKAFRSSKQFKQMEAVAEGSGEMAVRDLEGQMRALFVMTRDEYARLFIEATVEERNAFLVRQDRGFFPNLVDVSRVVQVPPSPLTGGKGKPKCSFRL